MDWQKRDTLKWLGKTVTVQVDRPIGYRHGDTVYPVNYGFVPGSAGGDGEEQDAYILGFTQPLTQFTGPVIGVIRRHDDCEDKLVVAPAGQEYHQGEIAAAVQFQEQYFTVSIDCLKRKSCGVIPYRETAQGREYLIVFEEFSQCWSFPKGHMEAGETELQTALREFWEETGLTADIDPTARASNTYPISPIARKEMVLFLGRTDGTPRPRAGEIQKYLWIKASELRRYLFPDTAAAVEMLILSQET